jgi:hypothetical protein
MVASGRPAGAGGRASGGRRAAGPPGALKSGLAIEPLTCIFAINAG